MNISRAAFASTLPFINSTLKKCHFVAIDLEMSGISLGTEFDGRHFDSLQLRYQKMKTSVMRNIPLQIGICGLELDSAGNQVTAYPFNFYLTPFTSIEQFNEYNYNPATMNFLAQNHFDFNKLHYEGVYFQCHSNIEKSLKKNQKLRLKPSKKVASPDALAFVKIYLPQFQEWFQAASKKPVPPLEIPISNLRMRAYQLLIETIENEHPRQNFLFVYDHKQVYRRTKLIITISKEPKNFKESKEPQFVRNQLFFGEIINTLSKNSIPIVVHNGLFDLMHIFHRFRNCLPITWGDFISQFHDFLPVVYDNKNICNNSPLLKGLLNGDTNLELTYKYLRAEHNDTHPKFLIPEIFSQYNLDSDKNHEAGFDALMTGYNFIRCMDMLEKPISTLLDPKFHQRSTLIRNKICLSKSFAINIECVEHNLFADETEPLHFRSVLNVSVDQKMIRSAVDSKYGAFTLAWKNNQYTQFCLFFLKKEGRKDFINSCGLSENGLALVVLKGVHFIVLTKEKQQELAENSFKIISLES